MKMKKKLFFICIFLFYSFFSTYLVQAKQEQEQPVSKAVLFLFDASGSMQKNDPDHLVLDSMAQLLYSLPSSYQVGFVAYNTTVVGKQKLLPPSSREKVVKEAEKILYSGYTHAGAGLSEAVRLLQKEKAEEKTIVWLSDGEIFMPQESETAASLQLFQKSLQQAQKQGIRIHMIGLGSEMQEGKGTLFSASQKTGGASYHAPYARDIQRAVDAILTEQLSISRTTAAILDASGNLETLTIRLPAQVPLARLLLTSQAEMKQIQADVKMAEDARKFLGKRYALLEIERPIKSEIALKVQGVFGNQIKVDLITEFSLQPVVQVSYTDIVPSKVSATHYERTAEITVQFREANNPNIPVFEDTLFQYASLPFHINGEAKTGVIEGGKLQFSYPSQKKQTLDLQFDYSHLPTNVLLGNTVSFSLEAAPLLPPKPEPEPEPDYRPLWLSLCAAGVLLALFLFFWLRYKRRRKPLPLPEESPPPPSQFPYTGKLNLYVTKTPSGYDIPPLSFQLFRIPSGRVLSLLDILLACNVEEPLAGASRIYFRPGAQQTLVLTNSSDCTILKNREVLLKNRSYSLVFESKLDLVFEDETSELTLQYKGLKPSEMRDSRF